MILDLRIRGNKKHKGIVCPKELKNIAEEIPLGCKAFYFFYFCEGSNYLELYVLLLHFLPT